MDLPALAFQGRAWQDVRTALNHAARRGIAVETGRWTSCPTPFGARWPRSRAGGPTGRRLPELGFTLGGLEEAADPEVWCRSPSTRPASSTASRRGCRRTARPTARSRAGRSTSCGVASGREAFRPVMELLIATSLLRFRDEGCAWASLSASPLAATGPAGRRSGLLAGLERTGANRLATRLEPLLRVPVAARLQGEVLAAVRTPLPRLPRRRGVAADRRWPWPAPTCPRPGCATSPPCGPTGIPRSDPLAVRRPRRG